MMFKQVDAQFYFFIPFSCLLLAFGFAYEDVNPFLRFDRIAIEQGEWWRLLTTHLVHFNVNHMLLNLSGLLMFQYFFYDVLDLRIWLMMIMVGFVGTGTALYQLDSSLYYYVGLSGVLHGIFVVGLVLSFKHTPKLNGAVMMVMVGRLTWEQMPIYDAMYMKDYIDGRVHVNAHLYGSICGVVTAALCYLWGKREPEEASDS